VLRFDGVNLAAAIWEKIEEKKELLF